MRARPELHETEIETETDYYETETETKKWSRDHILLETLASLEFNDTFSLIVLARYRIVID